MKKNVFTFIIIFTFVFSFGFSFAEESAGKLKAFEKKLDEKKVEKKKEDKSGQKKVVIEERASPKEMAYQEATSSLFQTMFYMLLAGLSENLDKEEFSHLYKELKKEEIPALPTFRVEGSYQYIFDDTHGFAGQGEVGYLVFGADGEYMNYRQNNPRDDLAFVSAHFLLRTYLMEAFQVNLAVGGKSIRGDATHDGFELGFPFYVFAGKHFIWDIKPYWSFVGGQDVYDISSGLSYKYKWFGIRAAYRAINVDDLTLHGPRIGMFVQF